MAQSLKRKRNENFEPRKVRFPGELLVSRNDARDKNSRSSHSREDGTRTDEEDAESNAAISEQEDELIGEDEEDWEGLGAGPAAIPTASDPGIRNKDKKLPTGEELRTIKDASDLFKSSSFKLQVGVLHQLVGACLIFCIQD